MCTKNNYIIGGKHLATSPHPFSTKAWAPWCMFHLWGSSSEMKLPTHGGTKSIVAAIVDASEVARLMAYEAWVHLYKFHLGGFSNEIKRPTRGKTKLISAAIVDASEVARVMAYGSLGSLVQVLSRGFE